MGAILRDPEAKAPGAKCSSCPLKDRPHVRPTPRRALLALVGERPDKHEVEHNRYFAGPTGELMDERILPYSGLTRKDLSLHNAVACTVDRKMSPSEWKQAIACCAPRLARDLSLSGSKAVLATGKRALQALTGRANITAWAGAPLQGWAFVHLTRTKGKRTEVILRPPLKGEEALADFSRYQILPAMHPAWHFRGNNIDYLPVSRIHFGRAKELALGTLKKWTWPQLIIEPGEPALRLLKLLHDKGRAGARISFDVETIGDDPFRAPLSCIGVGHRSLGAVSLTWESYDAGKFGSQRGVAKAPAESIAGRCREALLAILADARVEKVAQNGQYDLMCTRSRKIEVAGKVWDTMDGHAVIAPALVHNLAFICSTEFAAPRWKDEFQAGAGEVKGRAAFQKTDPEKLRLYNCKDNVMQSHVEGREVTRLKETHRGKELFEGYRELRSIANDMCFRGVLVDRKRRKFHHHALRTRVGQARVELEQIAEAMRLRNFNPDSGRDMRALFFGKFRVKPTKYSEVTGEPSLDEETLTPLVTHPNGLVQAAAKTGLRYRKWGTLDRNHVRGLRLDSRNVVHPFWKPTGTIGQRWSSSRPNSHNIPKPIEDRLPSGKRIVIHGGLRDMFIGHGQRSWIVEADYKAIEYRIAAFLANDKRTLAAFDAFDNHGGPDLHTLNAEALFGIKGRKPTGRERTLAKNFLYGGILYEGEPETIHSVLSVDTPIEMTLVEGMIERFFAIHPAYKVWHRQLVKEANEKGYVEEPVSGRRRHFWSARIKPTEVYNYPVQTLAGWIINQTIKKVAKEVDWGLTGISFQVHDALVLDGPDPLKLAEILHGCMDYTLNWGGRKMRFPVDVSVGGMTRDKETGRVARAAKISAWAPSAEMSLDEIRLLPKGKDRLRR